MSVPRDRTSALSPEQLDELIQRIQAKRAQGGDGGAAPLRDGPRPRGVHPGPLPLSAAQLRLWFLDRLDPASPAFNIPVALELEGKLRPGLLVEALSQVVARHEILRTTYRDEDGVPAQVVHGAHPLDLPVVDLSGLPEAAGRNTSEVLAQAHGALGFDLEAGPVLRAALLRRGPTDHGLFLSLHHIAADGASVELLCRELGALYRAGVEGQDGDLPALQVQYADFALWQDARLAGDHFARELEFWREELAGELPALGLPADRRRGDGTSYRGGRVGLRLDEAAARRVREVARRGEGTLFMVLAAALAEVLGRWAGQEEVVIGTPMAGRQRSALAPLIGCFLNLLALRLRREEGESWEERLRSTRRTVLRAFDHRELPFERVLEVVRPDRSLTRTPLFQALLNVQEAGGDEVNLAGLRLKGGGAQTVPSKFDLTLYAADRGEAGLDLDLVFNADLYDPERMAELLAQMAQLLAHAHRDPGALFEELSLLRPENLSIPEAAESLGPPRWTEGPLAERFARLALRRPAAPALVAGDRRWSYGELEGASRRLLAGLSHGGVQSGHRVAIHASRSPALVLAILALHRMGAVSFVLDAALPPGRRAALVEESDPQGWLALDEAGALPPEVSRAFEATGARGWWIDAEGGLRAAEGGALPQADADLTVPIPPEADDEAYLLFTSGTTGRPKGIVGTHGPLSHFATWYGETLALGEGDRVALLAGLGHDPLWRDTLVPLSLGAAVVVPPADLALQPGALRSWLAEAEVTVAHFTPSHLSLLLGGGGPELPTLRLAASGGEELAPSRLEALWSLAPKARWLGFYGASETPQAVAWQELGREAFGDGNEGLPERLSLGRGIDQVQLLVMRGAGVPAAVGELGEIWVRTPHLARGYLSGEAGGFGVYPADGSAAERIYRTGDLGRYLPDGRVVFAGRADDQLKVRGLRVEPAEIDGAAAALPGVRETAVAWRQRAGETELALFFVAAGVLTEGDLRKHLAAFLPAAAVPVFLVEIDALPRSANGKVDRPALLRRLAGRAAQGAPFEPPRTPTEALVAALWSELLEISTVGRWDDFFALGGHSLLATRMLARLHHRAGTEVAVRTLFENPTVAAFAESVERALCAGGAPQVELRPDRRQDGALSFAQERLWLLHRRQPGSAAYTIPLTLRLRGDLRVGRLRWALDRLAQRHEILATVYPTPNGLPRATVGESRGAIPLRVVDWTRHGGGGGLLVGELERASRRPFDLARGPVARCLLLRLSRHEHVIHLETHHIASDGWSSGLLLRDLAALYGGDPDLPPLPVTYADYAAWQRELAASGEFEAPLESLRRELAGAPTRIDLPAAGEARPTVPAGRLRQRIPTSRVDSLEALGRSRGATLFTLLLAALGEVLRRWSGQDDLVIGTVAASRERWELEELVGCFVNFLALRLRLTGVGQVADLLAEAQRAAEVGHGSRQVPFEKVVEALQPERGGANPLFNVALLLQDLPPVERLGRDLEAELVQRAPAPPLLDLRLLAARDPHGLTLLWEYDSGVFEGSTIEALGEAIEDTLDSLARRSEGVLGEDDLPAALRDAVRPEVEEPVRIALGATFTADPVAEVVRYWLDELEEPWQVELAPYAQVLQQLLDPGSLLRRNPRGVNVLLVRPEDLISAADLPRAQSGRSAARELAGALAAAAGSAGPWVLFLCPSAAVSGSAEKPGQALPAVTAFQEALLESLAEQPAILVVRPREILDLYPVAAVHEPHGDRVGHLPYTAEFLNALGTFVARRAWVLLTPPYKVVVADCDHSLWRGVCGEAGAPGVEVDGPRRWLQEFLLERQRQGMLLALCSKNSEDDIWAVFEERSDMVLRRSDLAAWRINWQPKSTNLAELAAELDLGLDSFIFLDDNPAEIAEVEAAHPEVLALEISDPEEIPDLLRHVWAFDRLRVTDEDRRRTDLYHQNAQRRRFENDAPSYGDFLAGLEMEIRSEAVGKASLPRAAQLSQRTNQFNFSLRRHREAELATLLAEGLESRTIWVRDRFGDYGQVGLALFRPGTEALEVESLLLSCRVLGRGVEHRLAAELGERALALGLDSVDLHWTRGPRNEPALAFLEEISGAEPQGAAGIQRIHARRLAECRHPALAEALEGAG